MTFLSSCGQGPASFWTEYKNGLIIMKENDQDLWVGYTHVQWESRKAGTFTSKGSLDFASENSWILADSIQLPFDSSLDSKCDDFSILLLSLKILPQWNITTGSKIFIFRTTRMAVNPDEGMDTFMTGFLLINPEGTEMKVYHLWGDQFVSDPKNFY